MTSETTMNTGSKETEELKMGTTFLAMSWDLSHLVLGISCGWVMMSTSTELTNHNQSYQIVKDVQGVLKDRVKPVFSEASEAMDAAALFFDNLVIKLEQMLDTGDEASKAPASEMHLHFEDMGQIMGELRAAVDGLSAISRNEKRRVQHTQ